jgi:Tat protein translocase TatB subunit
MFGPLGGPELFLIMVIALIVFGPRKLPEVGKSVGKMLAEFRRASTDFKRTIDGEIEAERHEPAVRETPPPPAMARPTQPAPAEAPSAPKPESSPAPDADEAE